jgi:hypothetical protein
LTSTGSQAPALALLLQLLPSCAFRSRFSYCSST